MALAAAFFKPGSVASEADRTSGLERGTDAPIASEARLARGLPIARDTWRLPPRVYVPRSRRRRRRTMALPLAAVPLTRPAGHPDER
jgi:hypothetical protein